MNAKEWRDHLNGTLAHLPHQRSRPLATTQDAQKKIARNAWHRARPGTTAFSTCDQPPEEDLAGAAVEAAGGVIAVEEAGGFIAVEAGGGVIAAVLAGAAVVAGVAAPFSF